MDTADVPVEPEHWGYRYGEPVTEMIDRWADRAAAEPADLFNPASVREAWQRLRDVPSATEASCWVHTDLSEERTSSFITTGNWPGRSTSEAWAWASATGP